MKRILIVTVGIVAAGCSSGSPVAPGNRATSVNGIEAAHVLVAGQPVEGTVMTGAHGATVFEVRMRERDHASLAGVGEVMLHYDVPRGSMMAHRTGDLLCYDDGTHGDDVAGDGVFHRADEAGSIGCGRAGSPTGTYSYSFSCTMMTGASCGEVELRVDRK